MTSILDLTVRVFLRTERTLVGSKLVYHILCISSIVRILFLTAKWMLHVDGVLPPCVAVVD